MEGGVKLTRTTSTKLSSASHRGERVFNERHFEIVRILQSAEDDMTAYAIGKKLNLHTNQIEAALAPLLERGVVKVDEQPNRKLYFLSVNAEDDMVDGFAGDIAEIVDTMLGEEESLNSDGVLFVLGLAMNKVGVEE